MATPALLAGAFALSALHNLRISFSICGLYSLIICPASEFHQSFQKDNENRDLIPGGAGSAII